MNKKLLAVPVVAITSVFGVFGISANNAQVQEAQATPNSDIAQVQIVEEPVAVTNEVVEVKEQVEPTQTEEVGNTPSEPVQAVETNPVVVEPTPEPQEQPPVSPEQDTCSVSWHDNIESRETMQNGNVFDANALTAAHRSLPFGTVVTIEYLGQSIDLVVTDRTTQSFSRCLDVTSGAFQQLAPLDQGIIIVEITVN